MSRADLLARADELSVLARYYTTPAWRAYYSARAELAAWHAARAQS